MAALRSSSIRSESRLAQSTSSSSSFSSYPSRGPNTTSNGGHHSQHNSSSVRSKVPLSRRSVSRAYSVDSNTSSHHSNDEDSGRVRVAVRLRPRNKEDLLADSDFADCVELQPELKRLMLRKNNWSSESFRFDELFTETASQRRVYEVVAKPVVESVLNGYNGTVMAYGQTGTGKTYTVGRLGKEDASERGIMVRALEDIISNTSPSFDCVEVSYLQLYMESIQDMLAPEKSNIQIHEDPKTGQVSLAGAEVVKVEDADHFLHLLQTGETNRHATNTNMNTVSSRSHAILMVYVRRSIKEKHEDDAFSQGNNLTSSLAGDNRLPTVRKSKLLIVDLAGSERLDKSGSEGHSLEEAKFINLSLTSLGKCINALAENSPHIPTRDSKLTRLLRDSFGGSARTSLIITIGPSARHHAETTSTVMFGQRAMKIVNMLKLKEEFDYESLSRKLENQVDHLTAEIERTQKLRENDKNELDKKLRECENFFGEAEKRLLTRSEFLKKENARLELEKKDFLNELNHQKHQNNLLGDEITQLELSLKDSKHHQLESSTYQQVLTDTTQMYEKKIAKLIQELENERSRSECAEEKSIVLEKHLSNHQKSTQQHQMEISNYKKELADTNKIYQKKVMELTKQLERDHTRIEEAEKLSKNLKSDNGNSMQKQIDGLKIQLQETNIVHESTLNELQSLQLEYKHILSEKEMLDETLHAVRQKLLVEEKKRETVENELVKLKNYAPDIDNDFEDKKSYVKDSTDVGPSAFEPSMRLHRSNHSRETLSGQRSTIAKIFEEVGLQRILALLASEDPYVQIHAVKVVANLAAEDINQEKIVEEGGLDALLMLLQSSQNTTVLRVASGAIANLAMNEMNQGLIMSKGGAHLLAERASKSDDTQTLRMIAGAIANLCGNEKLHIMLIEEGAIKALLGMVRTGNSDVIAQVARGLANFSKCESREVIQGHKKGRSLLMEDGALSWLISNATITLSSTRRHVELALCHLAQNEENAPDFIYSGGFKELLRITDESSRGDIRNLAKKTLKLSPTFQAEMQSQAQ